MLQRDCTLIELNRTKTNRINGLATSKKSNSVPVQHNEIKAVIYCCGNQLTWHAIAICYLDSNLPIEIFHTIDLFSRLGYCFVFLSKRESSTETNKQLIGIRMVKMQQSRMNGIRAQ